MTSEHPPDSSPPDFVELPVEMGEVDRRRVEGIAFLLASPDGASYRQRLREVSESLGDKEAGFNISKLGQHHPKDFQRLHLFFVNLLLVPQQLIQC
jgi:hypothetical protein